MDGQMTPNVERSPLKRVCRRLDKWASAHLLRKLYREQGGAVTATREELLVEAWLWEKYGKPASAQALRHAARSEGRAPGLPPPGAVPPPNPSGDATDWLDRLANRRKRKR